MTVTVERVLAVQAGQPLCSNGERASNEHEFVPASEPKPSERR